MRFSILPLLGATARLNFTTVEVSPAGLPQGYETRVFDIKSGADADSAVNINHGMPETPDDITLTALQVKGITGNWFISSITPVFVQVTKGNVGAGSSDAANQVRLIVRRRTAQHR